MKSTRRISSIMKNKFQGYLVKLGGFIGIYLNNEGMFEQLMYVIPEADWIKPWSSVWKASMQATNPGINLWYLKNKMYFVLLFCLLHISVVFIASKEINGLYEKEVPWRLMEWEISYNWWSRNYHWDWGAGSIFANTQYKE